MGSFTKHERDVAGRKTKSTRFFVLKMCSGTDTSPTKRPKFHMQVS